jgi:hypothetical protein
MLDCSQLLEKIVTEIKKCTFMNKIAEKIGIKE